MKICFFYFYPLSALLFLTNVHASTGSSWNLYVENDSAYVGGPGSDQAYSSGLKISYVYAQEKKPFWDVLYKPLMGVVEEARSVVNYGISVGHQIYTPENIRERNLIFNDRPYAAWLFLGFSTSIRTQDRLHLCNLNFGMVGPAAQGESLQNNFHKLIGEESAAGWKHQLADEFTLQFAYQQRNKILELGTEHANYFQLIGLGGVGLGNVRIHADVGAVLLLGYNVGNNLGPARPSTAQVEGLVDPSRFEQGPFSFYAFGAAVGSAYGRNIFLDGNNFEKSHSVDKEFFVGEVEGGLSARYKSLTLIWRLVTRSAEFKERKNPHSFASISLKYQNKF